MKKLIYLLFILSAVLCYAATRPSHGPHALPSLPPALSAFLKDKLPSHEKAISVPPAQEGTSAPHALVSYLPKPLQPFGSAYYLKDVLMAKIGRDNWIPLNKMPKNLPHALVAIEDRRFYEHAGIDLDAIMRAILVNIQSDKVVEGASTLTQQLVKNTLLTNQQSLERKMLEATLALEVESRYSKEDILEMYLNSTYFGAGATGVKAAAKTYFDLEPFQLSLAECAVLASLPYAPSALNPLEHKEDCKKRRDLVLAQMHKYGYIQQAELESAQKENLVTK